MKTKRPSSFPELGPEDEPGAPGAVPFPDHRTGIPAAPATHPPEPPVVPSESAIIEFFNGYGPSMLLVAAGLLIAVILLIGFGS